MKRDIAKFRAAYHSSAANYDNTAHLVTMDLDLPWVSAGSGEEWIYIDLGVRSAIESVSVVWGESYARAYAIQLSDDAEHWTTVAEAIGAADAAIETAICGEARYLRVLCTDCSGDSFVIRKIRVMGENELAYRVPPMPAAKADGSQPLCGGNWTIKRAEQVAADGAALSSADYGDADWLPATVPGTALVSYLNAGAIPDPDFDLNQFQISDAYFTADFWYRNRFTVPLERLGQRVYINFDAINWKADVYSNGVFLKNEHEHREHSIEGAFIRAKFDVTELVRFDEENFLAVYICKNATPGEVTTQGLALGPMPNGGALGADNPTIHAAVGWDWLPTIRGRDIGIYGDVFISYSREAVLVDPWIEPQLELISESSANPAEDLMLGEKVKILGVDGALADWRGVDGDAITVDFGESRTLGSVALIWGSEAGGPAAEADSRHAGRFSLEVSDDGENWRNFDAHHGGDFELPWIGKRHAEPHGGTDSYDGHSISDSVQGSTAIVSIDMSHIGRGVHEIKIFAPSEARYLRFTVVKRREMNGRPVDTRLDAIRVYGESPEQVEQGMKHSYELDLSKATLLLRTEVRNNGGEAVSAEICGNILPVGLPFSKTVSVQPGEILPVEIPILLENPKLWWPATYGEQYLYTADVRLNIGGEQSDAKEFKFGVRRFDYPTDGGLLTIYCNGVRIVCKGGNWGLDDGLKRDTARVMDDKVRLHAEENMTMIRNWVGMTSHPGFYEACDKYGVLIWDDFWLANPADGPEPDDPELFFENAIDKVKAVRGHAALCLYCGRNEGDPSEVIDPMLVEITAKYDGSRLYTPHSAAAPVGSGGGYSLAMPDEKHGIKQYFDDVSSTVLRSERGVPNVPNLESLRRFLKPENLWPISESWAIHDWTYHMNGPANTYMHALKTYLGGEFDVPIDRMQWQNPDENDPIYLAYKADIAKMCEECGKIWTIEDFSRAAQMINYDHHRGMFDALASRRANGLLMWMSQSSWPSFMWQSYDFYLDTNGGYFGCKAGNQPTRAIFDPRDDRVLLANATPNAYENVSTTVELFDLTSKLVSSQSFNTALLEADAYGIELTEVDYSASETDIVFLRLTLKDSAGKVLGENVYWHNRAEYHNYRALNTMAKADVRLEVLERRETDDGKLVYTLRVENGGTPALGVRIRLTDSDGSPVLPVFYSENYLMLMPGDAKLVTAEFAADRLAGEARWTLGGWNLA